MTVPVSPLRANSPRPLLPMILLAATLATAFSLAPTLFSGGARADSCEEAAADFEHGQHQRALKTIESCAAAGVAESQLLLGLALIEGKRAARPGARSRLGAPG